MEKEDSTEPKNVIDVAVNDMSLVFAQNDKIIQEFTNLVNKKGVNLNPTDISQLINFDDGEKIVNLIDALEWLVHNYSHHKELYQESLSNHKSDKKIVDKITKFLAQLNQTTLVGLNVSYELGRSDFLNRTTLIKYRDENMLKSITDENNEIIGHLPFVKLVFEFVDEREQPYQSIANLSLTGLDSLIELLKNTRNEAIKSAKVYRDKLGDMVIFEEDVK